MHTSKVFCPKCSDIYYPRSQRQANVDGAYFGTTFCHLFMQTYWDLKPTLQPERYVPRIFGFKIYKRGNEAEKKQDGGQNAAKNKNGAKDAAAAPPGSADGRRRAEPVEGAANGMSGTRAAAATAGGGAS